MTIAELNLHLEDIAFCGAVSDDALYLSEPDIQVFLDTCAREGIHR
ncbi:MAG: hypothetical protein V3U76_00435 [Granulosicoccus sp.]